MNFSGIVLTVGTMLVFAIGCASSGPPEAKMPHPNPVLPEWVSSPYVEGGMAATECIDANAPMSILKGQAASLTRAALAAELKTAIEDLKVNYQTKTQTEEGTTWSEDFDRVTRDLASQTMVGSRAARADYVTIRGEDKFCVMVIIDEKHSTAMRGKLFDQAKLVASPDDEAVLWEAFLKKSTMESLEAERASRK